MVVGWQHAEHQAEAPPRQDAQPHINLMGRTRAFGRDILFRSNPMLFLLHLS